MGSKPTRSQSSRTAPQRDADTVLGHYVRMPASIGVSVNEYNSSQGYRRRISRDRTWIRSPDRCRRTQRVVAFLHEPVGTWHPNYLNMIDAKLSGENASSPPDFRTIMFASVQLPIGSPIFFSTSASGEPSN
jgi:hypothetical protein